MTKKNLPILLVLLAVFIIFIGGYYLIYQNQSIKESDFGNLLIPESSQDENQSGAVCQDDGCEDLLAEIIDGKVKSIGQDYIEVENQDGEAMNLSLTEQTLYYKLVLDGDSNLISEEEIKREEIKADDDVSVTVTYPTSDSDKRTVSIVKLVIVND